MYMQLIFSKVLPLSQLSSKCFLKLTFCKQITPVKLRPHLLPDQRKKMHKKANQQLSSTKPILLDFAEKQAKPNQTTVITPIKQRLSHLSVV